MSPHVVISLALAGRTSLTLAGGMTRMTANVFPNVTNKSKTTAVERGQ